MTDPNTPNRWLWLNRVRRLLLPNVFDVRVLSVVLFWLTMWVTSVLSRTGLPRMDAVDLWLPWWSGVAGILAGLVLILLVRRPSRRTFVYAVSSAGVGLALHFAAAPLMGVREVPQDAYARRSAGLASVNAIGELVSNRWVLAVLALAVCLAIQFAIFASLRLGKTVDGRWTSWLGRLGQIRPSIVRHRVGVMTGFVAVMMPLIVLRNVFDPDSRSTPYLVFPAVAFALIVGSILIVPGVARLMGKAGWDHWLFLAFIVAVGGVLVWSWDDFQRGVVRGKSDDLAKMFVFPTFMAMILGTLMAGLVDRSTNDSPGRVASVSMVSPSLVLLMLGGLWHGQRAYDSRVVAISINQQPHDFLDGRWIDAAKHSRDLMRLTGGAARFLPDRYQPSVEVQIRGRNDADVIDLLCKTPLRRARSLVIRDVQPFVGLRQCGNTFSSVRFIGGELGNDQVQSMTGSLQGMMFDSVKLPTVLGKSLSVVNVSVLSKEHMGGLSALLDDCRRNGARSVYLHAPLSMADWESAVRNSSKTTHIRVFGKFLPVDAFSSSAITPTTDLSRLTVHSDDMIHQSQLLKLAIQNGLDLVSEQIDREKRWDFLVAAPEIWNWIPNIPRGDRDVSAYANDCRWAYGWNDDGSITHVWMPGMMLRADELAELLKLRTLRLDCRKFMESVQPTTDAYFTLGKLTGLERLYLNDVPVDSIHFLSDLVNLKHLQIYSPELGANVAGSFAVCKKLETLRLFGAPIPSTMQQLASLPELRRVEVIDDRAELLNPASEAKLRASLPGVEVVVTPTANYDPDLSEAFLKHRENVRRELIEHLDREIAMERQHEGAKFE